MHISNTVHGDLYEPVARLFSLLAHPARLRILDLLRRGEARVCHLQAVLGVPQPYVSQQLRVLREAGLISQRREGLYIYYRLADPQVEHLLAEVLGPVEETLPSEMGPHEQEKNRLRKGACPGLRPGLLDQPGDGLLD